MFVIMTTCKRSERPEQPFLGQAEGGKDRRYGVQGLEKKGSRDQFTSVFFIAWLVGCAYDILVFLSYHILDANLLASEYSLPYQVRSDWTMSMVLSSISITNLETPLSLIYLFTGARACGVTDTLNQSSFYWIGM